MTQREEHRSLYLSYLECCNKHDFDRMSSFYTSTIKVNDVPMDPAAVAAQFAPLFSAFPDWHWEIRNLVVDGDFVAGAFHGHRYPPGGLPRNRGDRSSGDYFGIHFLSPRRRQVRRGLGPRRYGLGDKADRAE